VPDSAALECGRAVLLAVFPVGRFLRLPRTVTGEAIRVGPDLGDLVETRMPVISATFRVRAQLGCPPVEAGSVTLAAYPSPRMPKKKPVRPLTRSRAHAVTRVLAARVLTVRRSHAPSDRWRSIRWGWSRKDRQNKVSPCGRVSFERVLSCAASVRENRDRPRVTVGPC